MLQIMSKRKRNQKKKEEKGMSLKEYYWLLCDHVTEKFYKMFYLTHTLIL